MFGNNLRKNMGMPPVSGGNSAPSKSAVDQVMELLSGLSPEELSMVEKQIESMLQNENTQSFQQ